MTAQDFFNAVDIARPRCNFFPKEKDILDAYQELPPPKATKQLDERPRRMTDEEASRNLKGLGIIAKMAVKAEVSEEEKSFVKKLAGTHHPELKKVL
jgi:hypothetical protein